MGCDIKKVEKHWCKQYLLQDVFARLYFLVKITAVKVSINFTGDKGVHNLLLLSDQMSFLIEKNYLNGS